MRKFVPCLRSSLMVRVAAVALVSGGLAACSSDSSRFGENPFSNPYDSASSERAPQRQRDAYATGSIQAAPSTRVQRAPLGDLPPAQSRPMTGFDGQGGTYRQSRVDPQSTGSVGAPRPYDGAPAASSGWSGQNGTTVTLRQGDTIHSISRRYGVPASAIMQANGLQNANGVGEGRQLVIPSYSAGGSGVAQAPVSRPGSSMGSSMMSSGALAPARPQAMATAPVAAAPKPRAPVAQQVAQAPSAQPMGWETGPAPAGAKTAEALKPVKSAAAPVAPKSQPSEQAFAAQPAKPQVGPSEANDNVKTAALKVDPAPAAEIAGPAFRWPVRGRVISGYGSKTNGSSNDGINLAVPEGTEVKASDDGVVAYSGSELKGFGNLVLIRHSNGWVTAYAHNSALNVKRGESVRRGQVIAKSGSTGSVTSPQLHFEVRKGAQTVDPLKHLPDA